MRMSHLAEVPWLYQSPVCVMTPTGQCPSHIRPGCPRSTRETQAAQGPGVGPAQPPGPLDPVRGPLGVTCPQAPVRATPRALPPRGSGGTATVSLPWAGRGSGATGKWKPREKGNWAEKCARVQRGPDTQAGLRESQTREDPGGGSGDTEETPRGQGQAQTPAGRQGLLSGGLLQLLNQPRPHKLVPGDPRLLPPQAQSRGLGGGQLSAPGSPSLLQSLQDSQRKVALPSPVPTPKTTPPPQLETMAGGYLPWIRNRAPGCNDSGQPCLSLASHPSPISKGSPLQPP